MSDVAIRHNTLFVLTPGTFIARDHESLVARVAGDQVIRVPIHHLTSVIASTTVSFSGEAVALCSEHGVAVLLLAGSRVIGLVERPGDMFVTTRRAQFRFTDDPVRRLAVAKRIVAAKIRNQRAVMARAARDAHDRRDIIAVEVAALDEWLFAIPGCLDVEELMGVEGSAAAAYFGGFASAVSPASSLSFDGRNRRPPMDPVNALLSFGYAMLVGDCVTAILAAGLDPNHGVLHAPRAGRPSLALDLMEEFRPLVVDRFVLTLVNRREFSSRDFTSPDGFGVYLTDQARRRFIRLYQERKASVVLYPTAGSRVQLGDVPLLNARLLAAVFRGETAEYVGFMP